MSAFSDLFSRYVHEKDVKVQSLVNYCETDRSTMYKIINGKRNPPSLELFDKLCKFMQLTPYEQSEFKEAYYITILTEKVYYKRKNAESFLLNFPFHFAEQNKSNTLFSSSAAVGFDGQSIPACSALASQVEVNAAIQCILMDEANKSKGHIGLFLQPDSDFLFGHLTNLKSEGKLSIEHILCFNKTDAMTRDHKFYNLLYIEKILPCYLQEYNYNAYYFYDDIHSHYYNYNGFPYMILGDDYAITCASDFKSGILYHDAGVIKLLWGFFHTCQISCQKLFTIWDTLEEQMDFSNSVVRNSMPESVYILEPESCILAAITPELVEAVIAPTLPHRDYLVPVFQRHVQHVKEEVDSGSVYIYYSLKGIANFIQTGKLSELPGDLYRPFTMEERIDTLKRMLPYCRSGCYKLVKEPFDNLSLDFHFLIGAATGYIFLSNVRGNNAYLYFNESSMISIFYDYIRSLDETYLYSEEETVKEMEKLIVRYDN